MGLHHSTPKSFIYAFQGIKTALKQEPNFRIQILIGIIALILGILLKISTLEWLILSFTIFYVLTLELINTVMEAFVNLVSPQYQYFAKIAKDVSAACVLLAALLSVVVGFIIFLPKLIFLITN